MASTKSADKPAEDAPQQQPEQEKLNKPVPSVGPDDAAYHEQYQKTQMQLAEAQRPAEEGDKDAEPVAPYSEEGSFHG